MGLQPEIWQSAKDNENRLEQLLLRVLEERERNALGKLKQASKRIQKRDKALRFRVSPQRFANRQRRGKGDRYYLGVADLKLLYGYRSSGDT